MKTKYWQVLDGHNNPVRIIEAKSEQDAKEQLKLESGDHIGWQRAEPVDTNEPHADLKIKNLYENLKQETDKNLFLEPAINTHSTGAKREVFKYDYWQIPPNVLRRLAAIFSEGRARYGVYNWAKGLDVDDTYNHLFEHLMAWKQAHDAQTDESCDNLAKVLWGILVLMYEQDIEFGRADRIKT